MVVGLSLGIRVEFQEMSDDLLLLPIVDQEFVLSNDSNKLILNDCGIITQTTTHTFEQVAHHASDDASSQATTLNFTGVRVQLFCV